MKRIAAGANSQVYLGQHVVLDRRVAVKTTCPYADHDSRRRFRREAVCASALNHPNIAVLYDFFQDLEADFIVMEYVPGRALSEVIPPHGFPVKTFLDYARQIAGAVAAVHSAGMVHRDLKPANFVITTSQIIKLVDFGLVKIASQKRARCSTMRRSTWDVETHYGTILGTVGYMSPEQVRGRVANQGSDVFSLGSVFYEMLTGRRAFEEATPIETMTAILQKMPELPKRVISPVSTIVRRCLEKDPECRFKNANELAMNLKRVTEGDLRR